MYDVVTLGNYTKDTVANSAGERHVDGGGVRYSAYAAKGLGCKVAAVTRLAREDWHVVEAFERAGIDTFALETPSSTLMRLEYPTDNPDERILTMADTAGTFTPDQVAAIEAKAFLVSASIRDEVPLDVIEELRGKNANISLDVQGYVRIRHANGRLEHAAWPEQREVLSKIDIVKTDAVEAESLTGESDIRAAALALAAYGPSEIVLTHRDGLLVFAGEEFHEAGFFPESMVGRSGRGDTCLGSYVATRLTMEPAEATVWAAAATSLKMETDGPFQRNRADVVDLIDRRYRVAGRRP